jgi:amidase
VKESYNVAGLPTTWGFPPQKDFRPPEDALAISRVKDAGGVILGKTNVPVGLGDWQSYNDIYGTTNNPYEPRPNAGRLVRRIVRGAGRGLRPAARR